MPLNTSPRLHIVDDLQADKPITIIDGQAHYLLHVMRMKHGDDIRLFNGRDGEWHGTVSKIGKKSLQFQLVKQIKLQTQTPYIGLYCAPIKKAHFDYMIEKATELGVAFIQPILTSRTQIREVNVKRYRSIATEAAEQSERLSIPAIENPLTLDALAHQWPKDRTMIVCAEFGDAQPVDGAFRTSTLQKSKSVGIVTGPEGGFTVKELERLRQISNAVFIRLGPRILRADTAAISALSCWQALCGDWKQNTEDKDQASE